MIQYDVRANSSRSAVDGIPYVVVIQSDLLNSLARYLEHCRQAAAKLLLIVAVCCVFIQLNPRGRYGDVSLPYGV